MKDNSYYASGFKYGLVVNRAPKNPAIEKILPKKESCNCCAREEKIEKIDDSIPLEHVIPFENVDGLTMEELKDYYSLNFNDHYLIFLMYDYVPYEFSSNYGRYVRGRYAIVLDTDENKEYGIDEVIEDIIMRHVEQMDKPLKRRALGFLQQYTISGCSQVDVDNTIYNIRKIFVNNDSRLRTINNRK